MQVSGNPIKRAVTSWFVGKNKRTKNDLSRQVIKSELMRRIARPKIVVPSGEKQFDILVTLSPFIHQMIEIGLVFDSAVY